MGVVVPGGSPQAPADGARHHLGGIPAAPQEFLELALEAAQLAVAVAEIEEFPVFGEALQAVRDPGRVAPDEDRVILEDEDALTTQSAI